MSRHRLSALVLALALVCADDSARASNCSVTSTGMIPLTDLGTGSYQGFQGGLYAGGSNTRPEAHGRAGLSIANSIVPLDTLGGSDPHGRVVIISIGMSNTTQEFSTFVPKAVADPQKRAEVLPIDCAKGGQAASDIADPNAAYWDTVYTRLRGHGSAPLQAQVVWLKEALRQPSSGFPAATVTLQTYLGTIVRIIKQKLPNVRLCYLTSRIYAGYASSNLNPEPYAYESGFAVKWLIDQQINGEPTLNYDPAIGPVEAPWLSWGPYLWADGLHARNDGLTWSCSDFQSDGTHPSTSGRNIVADSLLAFFRGEETAVPWYRVPVVAVAPATTASDLAVAPTLAHGRVEISFTARSPWRIEIVDLAGRRVRDVARGQGDGVLDRVTWDLHDQSGARVRSGAYWVRLDQDGRAAVRRVTVVGR